MLCFHNHSTGRPLRLTTSPMLTSPVRLSNLFVSSGSWLVGSSVCRVDTGCTYSAHSHSRHITGRRSPNVGTLCGSRGRPGSKPKYILCGPHVHTLEVGRRGGGTPTATHECRRPGYQRGVENKASATKAGSFRVVGQHQSSM